MCKMIIQPQDPVIFKIFTDKVCVNIFTGMTGIKAVRVTQLYMANEKKVKT